MAHLTIRNLPDELHRALAREKKRRGQSLNQTVIDLLAEVLGATGKPRSNGLAKLAGGWTHEEFREFASTQDVLEQVDEELWH